MLMSGLLASTAQRMGFPPRAAIAIHREAIGSSYRQPLTTLETLSCFGSTASTRCMAVACDVEADQCAAYADAAEQGGFIVKTESGYRFSHDRIQEAAYALIPEAARPRRHLEIARRLCANLTDDEVKAHIFDIANQLAPGIALIEQHERLRAAGHFKAAGERAKAETAYAAALRHFEHADALLGSDRWISSYALALAVAIGLAECRFLVGEMHAAEEILLDVQDRARNTVDRADVTWRQVTLYTALDRSDEAKHAFRQRDHGQVQVSLHLVGGGQCELSVADDGAGLPADLDISLAATLGLQLVDDLAAQLRGELVVERDSGTRFRIRFPSNDSGER